MLIALAGKQTRPSVLPADHTYRLVIEYRLVRFRLPGEKYLQEPSEAGRVFAFKYLIGQTISSLQVFVHYSMFYDYLRASLCLLDATFDLVTLPMKCS